jgi:hypothetical protein
MRLKERARLPKYLNDQNPVFVPQNNGPLTLLYKNGLLIGSWGTGGRERLFDLF